MGEGTRGMGKVREGEGGMGEERKERERGRNT